ncbi:unnamed protein product, partial [Nesidiocoris tenuis]
VPLGHYLWRDLPQHHHQPLIYIDHLTSLLHVLFRTLRLWRLSDLSMAMIRIPMAYYHYTLHKLPIAETVQHIRVIDREHYRNITSPRSLKPTLLHGYLIQKNSLKKRHCE